jgi:DNA helicase-2/ATP-dependent DNA helicase PcrA
VQPSLVEALPPGERARYEELAGDRRKLASHLREREGATPGEERWLPSTIAVSGVIDYARCPKRFYWSQVRPLPRFSGPAARIGTEVHRWIERRASGQASLIELDESPDLTAEELTGEPGKVERLREAFQASRFAGRVPRYAERSFLLSLDGFRVGGRIDAIYGEDDGPWEVVDWKTGRKPVEDPLAGLQLDVYGLACVDIWRKRPEDLTLTYLYLASEEEVSHPMGDPEEVRTRVLEALRSMASGAFAPTPGTYCEHCDFLAFCDAGKAWLSGRAR